MKIGFRSYFSLLRPYIKRGEITSYKGKLLSLLSEFKQKIAFEKRSYDFVKSIISAELIDKEKQELIELLGNENFVTPEVLTDVISAQLCDIVKYFSFQNRYIDYIEFYFDSYNLKFNIEFGFNTEIEREYFRFKNDIDMLKDTIGTEQEYSPDEIESAILKRLVQLKDLDTIEDVEALETEAENDIEKTIGNVKVNNTEGVISDVTVLKIKTIYMEFINDLIYERLRRFIMDNFRYWEIIIRLIEDWDGYEIKYIEGKKPKYYLVKVVDLKYSLRK